MPLVVDQLQLWTVGFKWAGLDPNRLWLRIPTPVQENFSTLLSEILNFHLDCMTLGAEKYEGDAPEVAKCYVRYWLDDVYAAIEGKRFSRRLLKWAVVDRGAFQDWCERRSIPLPEFWFPPGWSDYRWPEEDPPPQQEAHATPLTAETQAPPTVTTPEAPATRPTVDAESPVAPSPISTSPEDDPALKWRTNQRNRAACQVIAEVLWKANPTMTIEAMSKHDLVRVYGQGGHYEQETVKAWIRTVAPREVREKRGRPKKENPSEDE